MLFRTIVADPPWDYEVWSDKAEGKPPYSLLALRDIACLAVEKVAAKDAVLLMWCTWPFLSDAIRVMENWGFEYKTGFPWLKLSRDMIPRIGTGFHVRHCTEPLLIGTRGKPCAPEPFERMEGVLFSKLGKHSAKPDEIYRRAELYDGPYLEMFARPDGALLPFDREHWTQIGNEITGRDIADDLRMLADKE